MEEKIERLLSEVQTALDENDDILVIARHGDQCAAVVSGNVEEIAEAFFCCMHSPGHPNEQKLYDILKLNIYNILSCNSYLAENFKATLKEIISHEERISALRTFSPSDLN